MTAPDTVLYVFLIAAAPFVGSFLGVLAMRLPAGEPVIAARSRCDTCRAALGPRDLVPVVSWLATARACRHCGAPLPIFYPVMELGALGIAVLAAVAMPVPLFAVTCGLGWALLALAAADWRAMILPDVLTLPLIPAGLAVAAWQPAYPFADHLIGMAAGGAGLWAVNWLYRRARGHDGLGMGDAKLFAGAGAWLGWQGLPGVLLAGSFLALGIVFLWQLAGREMTRTTALPFGTPLAAGFFLAWIAARGVFP